MTKRQRAQALLQKLRATYTRKPDSFVHGATSLHLLVAIILSAQCTDTKAFGKNVGIAVDTHVMRLAQKLGLRKHTDPIKIERDLMAVIPKKEWFAFTYRLIDYGRAYCVARPHDHAKCPLTAVLQGVL